MAQFIVIRHIHVLQGSNIDEEKQQQYQEEQVQNILGRLRENNVRVPVVYSCGCEDPVITALRIVTELKSTEIRVWRYCPGSDYRIRFDLDEIGRDMELWGYENRLLIGHHSTPYAVVSDFRRKFFRGYYHIISSSISESVGNGRGARVEFEWGREPVQRKLISINPF